ncbi:MAG: hypothetical protein DWQ47_03010 [Acidobacteria bacterium]|nr:MAG: hypothetical protein DWQ32_06560 [Acidobacteriota bacterium]REK01374.1 MAG: hypothetical protein DWQ38_02995 [Acidobacteriota bacterium]REK14330.1 MAG: hypothetical protein DWQ43_12250 [Acidobacteriota bacterium]REK45045.1 MAG: hypothetical protein DWQ47_03010 [Acidobacteriota bacterium]
MRNPEEAWQVDVNGQVYDTTFGELPTWIADNALLETDKVRRGELRWLEAGKVPALVPFFNAKAEGRELPGVSVTTTVAETPSDREAVPEQQEADVHGTWQNNENDQEMTSAPATEAVAVPNQGFCSIHKEVPSKYVCSACHHPFCGECPEGFGANVRICPYCGAMCKDAAQAAMEDQEERQFRADIAAGFGFDDFGKAISYPFKYKSSLVIGGFLFAILTIGQSAGSMGSIFLIAAALFCFMMANALTFGVLAHTVNDFSQGKIGKDFMPSFDDFSLWEDVVHPFFLSVAVYASSFGLLILLVVGMVWYAWSTFSQAISPGGDPAMAMLAEDEGQTPAHLQEIMRKAREQNEMLGETEVGEDGLTDLQRSTLEEEAEFMRLNEMAENYRGQQLESVVGPTPEQQEAQLHAAVMQFIRVAGAFIILAGLAFFWGIFYFPAACAVAGYTRSFTATINPLVGLDTIRHLGVDYLKILVMVFLISIASGIVGMILGMIFFPFDLPAFGNLPAKFFGGFVTFYFSVVFSVTLGYALYKNSEKLGFYRS